MNQAPNNNNNSGGLSGMNTTFSPQSTPQTNPFTADLKGGEFTSNFGTNTNAVSQIFKEGGFVSQNRTKYLLIGLGVVLVVAIAFFVISSGSEDDSLIAEDDKITDESKGDEDEEIADADADEKLDEKTAAKEEGKVEDKVEAKPEAAQPKVVDAQPAAPQVKAPTAGFTGMPEGRGAPVASSPESGASMEYDETMEAPTFTWSGGGGYITFARSQDMSQPAMRQRVRGNSYTFHYPHPGQWFWQVKNASGSTEVRSFTITAPTRRNVQLTSPAGGGTIAGNGGQVAWQGDSKVSYYRVEMSTGSFANPQFRFATAGNQVQIDGVQAGQYQMRVGAFSEVSGRWEYTTPVSVTVQ